MELDKELLQKIIDDVSMSSRETVADKYDISDRVASYYWVIAQNMGTLQGFFETDDEIVEQNVKYQKQKQKFQDFNRIERKSFREQARVENAVEEYTKQLVQVIGDNPYKCVGIAHKGHAVAPSGIVHITDVHFNELINLDTNRYDFTVASKRFHKLVMKAIEYFSTHGVVDVFVLLTGDMMNSDRRLDELVSMATNRAKASFIGVQILENVLSHLNKHFNVHVAGICGNESRMGKDYNWSNDLVSDNYDFTIFNTLRYKLKDTVGINFLGLSDKHEEVVSVNGINVLLIHGHQVGKDTSKDMSKLIRKWLNKGVEVHYIVYGHLHEALISDMFSRGSSLCGSNNYSEDSLLLVGKASQNLHLIFKDGIDSIKIDLQDTSNYEGYDTHDWQDAYNPKSIDKTQKKETILRITI